MKPTIKQIAEKAGVSEATVSYVLNGKSGVSKETSDRIKKIMHDCGYKANLNSQRLATGKSYNIHAVIRKAAAPGCKAFYQEVMLALLDNVTERGYNLLSAYHNEDSIDSALISSIKNGNTDGMIFFQGMDATVYSAVKEYDVPAVIVNPGFDPRDIPTVNIDFYKLAYRATKYLCDNGHKRIAFLGMCALPSFYEVSFAGFSRAMTESGNDIDERLVLADLTDEKEALERSRELLRTGAIPTAAFCAQDVFAISFIKAVALEGYSVPDDISVIGIDDLRVSGYVTPGLTTIMVSPNELAEKATGIIFDLISGKTASSQTVEKTDLIVRESVKQFE